MGEQNGEALEPAVKSEIEELFSSNGPFKDLSGSIDSDVLNLSVLAIANSLRRLGKTDEDGIKEACHIYVMGCSASHSAEGFRSLGEHFEKYMQFLASYKP